MILPSPSIYHSPMIPRWVILSLLNGRSIVNIPEYNRIAGDVDVLTSRRGPENSPSAFAVLHVMQVVEFWWVGSRWVWVRVAIKRILVPGSSFCSPLSFAPLLVVKPSSILTCILSN